MEVSAIAKRLQISPQKVRLVADQVRGKVGAVSFPMALVT